MNAQARTESTVVDELVRRYEARTFQSQQLHQRALRALPGGDTRSALHFEPHPVYVESGHGATLVDVDGNEYLDLLSNYTASVVGQAHPAVVAAVETALHQGTSYAAPAIGQVELAEILTARLSTDHARLTNSGSEANIVALRAARAATGRWRIAKAIGGYHGSHETVLYGSPFGVEPPGSADSAHRILDSMPGIPAEMVAGVSLIPYNDIDGSVAVIRSAGDELAAVIVEPMLGGGGAVPASPEYLAALRYECDRYGIVLIFDEVITFRHSEGGLQQTLGVQPDLTSLGKMIGGAVAGIGAVVGSERVMAVFDPRRPDHVTHHGTFNGSPAVMAAGLATLKLYRQSAIEAMNRVGERIQATILQEFDRAGIRVEITGIPSVFNVHLKPRQVPHINDYEAVIRCPRQAWRPIHLGLLLRGVFSAPRGMFALNTAVTDSDANTLAEAFRQTLSELRPWLASNVPEILVDADG